MRIALIGAGPRSIVMLERLCARHSGADVTVYDPEEIGGRVWRAQQSHLLLMNTPAGQITVFPDDSLGHLTPGTNVTPTLAAWAHNGAADFIAGLILEPTQADALIAEAGSLAPRDYATRALYGCYLRWAATRITAAFAGTVTFVRTTITSITTTGNGIYHVTSAHGTAEHDHVVMALGNQLDQPTSEQTQLANYAAANGLRYTAPGFPDAADLSGQTVAVRGLGLSFFDIMAGLTLGRGGHFVHGNHDLLRYIPSGNEPHIVAGSRRGLPYRAKGTDAKRPGEQYQPHFLTAARLAEWQRTGVTTATVWELLKRECEYVYYTKLLATTRPHRVQAWSRSFMTAPEDAIAALPPADRLDWKRIERPVTFASTQQWQDDMLTYLQSDVRAAYRGNTTDPIASMLEALRDMRVPLRKIVAAQLLDADDFLDNFRRLTPLTSMLTVGPPAVRINQMQALMEAGVLEIVSPGMTVDTQNGAFVISSTSNPSRQVRTDALIDAMMPPINAAVADNPLIQQLLRDGFATLHTRQRANGTRTATGAVAVDPATMELLNAHGEAQPGLYFWGVPTEGQFWLTTASPHPFVSDVNIATADTIAAAMVPDR